MKRFSYLTTSLVFTVLALWSSATFAQDTARAPEQFYVRFETTQGAFVMEVHRHWAPLGVDRFHELVTTSFFDDSRFYRVRAGFIVQFGIAGRPEVASAWRHRTMPDDSVVQTNTRGMVAFAMTGPNTRTTQIYINLVDNSRLDADGFAPFGLVIEGMDVVDRLYSGYGEESGGGMRTGKQDSLFTGGNRWLDASYPQLDKLITARVLENR